MVDFRPTHTQRETAVRRSWRRRLFHSCAARPTNTSRGPRTPVAWWRSLWSLEENTLKAACIFCYRHVPCAPLTAGLIVCVANLMSDHAMARRLNDGRRV